VEVSVKNVMPRHLVYCFCHW